MLAKIIHNFKKMRYNQSSSSYLSHTHAFQIPAMYLTCSNHQLSETFQNILLT